MRLACSLILFLLISAAEAQSQFGLHAKLYDVEKRALTTLSQIVERMADNQILFFGEEHYDSIGHMAQDSLYRLLVDRYKDVTLSLEMFERDCQLVVNEYLKGQITDAQLVKDGRAWKNYKDYRPMVNTARDKHQAVVAANAPRRYVNMVSRNGLASLNGLDKESKKHFAALPIDTVNTPYYTKFAALMGNQSHFKGRNMYYAQTLWDATMAESIYNSWKQHKGTRILHLNGRFHTDEELGTVTQLQRMSRKLKIVTISSFAADDFQNPDWTKYEKLADFILLTDPSVPKTSK